jgi:hypothetical protein
MTLLVEELRVISRSNGSGDEPTIVPGGVGRGIDIAIKGGPGDARAGVDGDLECGSVSDDQKFIASGITSALTYG